jgi:pyruvate dehydrogenase E1 component beta subunit
MAKKVTMIQALNHVLDVEMAKDKDIFLIGEDVGYYGGVFAVSEGLIQKYGEERVINSPISEYGFSTMAVGAAIAGKKPIVELMFADFLALAGDAFAGQAASVWYVTNGQATAPIVCRAAQGYAGGAGIHHSQVADAWHMNYPGLKIAVPSTPADCGGMLRAAIYDPNPVLFLEHKALYGDLGEMPEDDDFIIPLGKADVVREGGDVTVMAGQLMRKFALKAAEEAAKEGISVELLDPRTVRPFDIDTVSASVKKTGRMIIVHESPVFGGPGGEHSAQVYERCFADLKKPILRLGRAEVPIPYGAEESTVFPTAESILTAIRNIARS